MRRANGGLTVFSTVRCLPILFAIYLTKRSVVLEHGSKKHQDMALDHLLAGLLEYAMNEQGVKSVTKALKEGGRETLDKIIKRMCEPAKG